MPLTLAIIGRPNVGKSSIFNRLVGRRVAIVHDTPGVTRDRRAAEAEFHGLALRVIDTAGFEEASPESLSGRMTGQSMAAIAEAGAILFVIDARAGVTTGDQIIAQTLRRSGKPVILAANKCEGRTEPVADMYALGFGEPLRLSAEHALGFEDLAEALEKYAPVSNAEKEEEQEQEQAEDEYYDYNTKPLRLALVGRPNVGKSSLFNRLLGDERSIVGPEAGLTRDSITAPWKIGGKDGERQVLLHDTAGLRKKARAAGETLEELSVASTLDAIRFADCVIVMIDATQPFEKQDLAIADLIAREGRAVVFAVNKWDLLENSQGAVSELREKLDRLLPQVAGAEMVGISAKTGQGLDRLAPAVAAADKAWNSRVPTAALNRFLEAALMRHATPAISGRRVRIRYMTQVKSRPPTFALFGNQLDALPEAYGRYLTNGLRENFGLKGTPLRLVMRNTKNPYDPKR
ncbi:MAG TPA: ribosome biogenesis GTPase Der [Rhizomicrobium sp.]|jgi:GTP-binding protein|nr:ribosome biogenesis GTPase Der [Rhizomicrobium sp.]